MSYREPETIEELRAALQEERRNAAAALEKVSEVSSDLRLTRQVIGVLATVAKVVWATGKHAFFIWCFTSLWYQPMSWIDLKDGPWGFSIWLGIMTWIGLMGWRAEQQFEAKAARNDDLRRKCAESG